MQSLLQVYVTLDTSQYTIRLFRDRVLKAALSMIAPDVNTTDGRIIISSEEGELTGASFCERLMRMAGYCRAVGQDHGGSWCERKVRRTDSGRFRAVTRDSSRSCASVSLGFSARVVRNYLLQDGCVDG